MAAGSYGVALQFGANLVRCRKRAGISQEEFGFRASLHRTEIGMLERGVRLPRIDTLIKLAGSIEAPPSQLLEGIEWRVPPPIFGAFSTQPDPDPTEGCKR
jgi:transcriptional regulator with XRE-family HTH domain